MIPAMAAAPIAMPTMAPIGRDTLEEDEDEELEELPPLLLLSLLLSLLASPVSPPLSAPESAPDPDPDPEEVVWLARDVVLALLVLLPEAGAGTALGSSVE